MVFIHWIRDVRGYVEFEISGAFAEKFLNLVSQSGLSIWDIRHVRDTVFACTKASDYKKMRKAAKKAMVKLKITKKHGVPFTRYKYRKRWGIAAGAVIFVLGIIIMSMFIWRVEINGLETLDEQKVLNILNQYGLKSGVLRSSIDVEKIENEMRLAVDEISWIAINIDGSTAEIEIKERTMAPQMLPDDDIVCNIVAGKSGQISKMEVYAGQEVVKEGDSVNKGDLIVSGIMEDKAGKTTFKHARAKIYAIIEEKKRVEVPFEKTVRVQSGESENKKSIALFGKEIPLYFGKKDNANYDIERSEKQYRVFGIDFSISTYTFTPVEEKTVTLTEHEAKEEAMKKLNEFEEKALSGAQIISRSINSGTSKDNGNTFYIEANYKYEQDIAVERQVLTENQ